ncbi:MAG TPA: tetratricopeptide repeat protein, partial [Puia sp.]
YELYHNRGSAWRKKGEYKKAIADYHQAIRLKPNHGRSFFGLGIAYEALGEFELAVQHYKRAYYLGFDRTQLVRLFGEQYPAPYIVKAILAANGNDKGVEASLATLQWMTAACKGWDGFLAYLRRSGYHATHPEKYHALEAIVHYYMGDPMEAYRIFDTRFDSEEYPYTLTRRDQYYLAMAAMDFREPDNGLAYAVGEMTKAGDLTKVGEVRTADAASQLMDDYYAGQLFLMHNDPEEALRRLQQCGDFPPALYGKIALYQWLEDNEGLVRTAREIAGLQEDPCLDGIEPVVIEEGESMEEMVNRLFALLPYYELREEVEKTRALLGRAPARPHLEFHALLRLPDSIEG